MGLLQRIFRRKSSLENSAPVTPSAAAAASVGKSSSSWRRKGAARSQREDSPTQLMVEEPVLATTTAAAINTAVHHPSSTATRPKLRGPDVSEGTQRPVRTPRSAVVPTSVRSATPVDLDESRESETTHDDAPSKEKAVFSMPALIPPKLRFSAGNVSVGSADTDGGESSSFNLSTDAEDTEYEAMRRRLGVSTASVPMDMSVTNYTTDGETSVFPGLLSEDDATHTTVTKEAAQNSILHLPTVNPATGASLVPDAPPKRGEELPHRPKEPTAMAATSRLAKKDPPEQKAVVESAASAPPMSRTMPAPVAPLDVSQRESPKTTRSPKGMTTKTTATTSNNHSFTQYNAQFLDAIYGGTTAEVSSQRRNFTSPKKAAEKATTADTFEPFAMEEATHDFATTEGLFADFADFSNFENAFAPPQPTTTAPKESSSSLGGRSSTDRNATVPQGNGAIHNDTSLNELLEKAKSKSSRSIKKTSVSSAPAMSSSYLRQHHNLGPARSARELGGTSVTDIIQSLEAANATRVASSRGGRGSRDDGFSSAHSREGTVDKEKLRRRRERRQQRGAEAHSSDSEEEENESWLLDEVTGALGPRGIAADLESLSGRSNRSNSSRGNKSHRSHRSHKSGSRSSRQHRRKSDSADSVESHHSRDSRRSRGSRYSHRSTRSYISQMSEQSRSVANDLLRLEMQLAMVGSNAAALEGPRSTRSARPQPPAASTSRRMATARRSRITIQAPPGRLGIILANKADARGTVVSGIRSSSALVDRISPGDRIVAIDGEDVSLMTVSEITTIMARKGDFERTLTVLTTPRHADAVTTSSVGSPRSTGDSFHQHRSSYRG